MSPSPSTSRKTPDAALMAAAVHHLEDSIMITDTDLDQPGPRIIYVNPAFTRITGYTAEEAVGRDPRFLQGAKTDRKVLNRLKRELKQGKVFYGQTVNYRKDGSAFINEWHIEPIKNKNGTVTHYLGIQRDVTERVRKDEKLREQAETLTRKNIALREILEHIEEEKKQIKDDIKANIEKVILPSLRKLRRRTTGASRQQLDMLEQNLNELHSPFSRAVSDDKVKLSPRELEIANLIKNGMTNKDIAALMHLSVKTVETHRNRIRKKLGILHQNANLSTYLRSF